MYNKRLRTIMPKPIGTLLSAIIPSEHLWKIKLFGHWEEIIGNLKEKVRIEKITNNSITLGVYHSTWAQELFLLSPVLKNKINSFLDEERIKKIQFRTIRRTKREKQKSIKKKENRTESIHEQTLTIGEHNHLLSLQKIGPNNSDLIQALETFCLRCKRTKKGNTP